MLLPDQKILTVANESEKKFLRKKTASFDFSKFTKREIRDLVERMRKIMKFHEGVGLSANQVGLNFQVFVAEFREKPEDSPKFYAFFNPEILKFSKEESLMEEGCLSVPKIFGQVERPMSITIAGLDKNERPIKIKAEGILARIFQHEVDHLNGVLFIDKATELYESKDGEEEKEPL